MADESTLSPEKVSEAEEVKNEANKAFQEGKHDLAVTLYSKAIEINPNVAVYYANRSFAFTKLEQYGAAVNDATRSIELDKTYAKGYYRRGSAYLALGKYKAGLADFRQVVRIYPRSKEASEKLQQCEKIVRRIAFEEAIEVSEEKASDTIDVSSMDVEESYKGPHLPSPITLDFVKELVELLRGQGKLPVKYVCQILLQAKTLFSRLDSLITVKVEKGFPLQVCGDTHGQFYDVLNIFDTYGLPSEKTPYLFNGDFVDRGSFSFEVIITFLALKLLYPTHMHLLRGNHETLSMNRVYGFEGEVVSKYSKRVFDLFTEVFNWLPLAALLEGEEKGRVLVLHGGLFSKDGVKLEDIRKVQRNSQPPEDGIFCEMLWSDPQPFPGRAPNKRGVGVAFGPDVTAKFLEENSLDMLVRSHEVKEEGYLVEANGKLVTVFSAPNYCDQAGNKGALIQFNERMEPTYRQFTAVPHPPIKPMAYANTFGMF